MPIDTTGSRRVLVVAAHADDEILGAGGSLALHAEAGDALFFLVLSTSIRSRADAGDRSETQAHRTSCAEKVARMYGAGLDIRDHPDNGFDTVSHLTLVQAVEEVVEAFRPTMVYGHSRADLSMDHRLAASATATACRPAPDSPVQTLLAFEIRSATEWGTADHFTPTCFRPLTPRAVAMKTEALHIYDSEMRPWPHPRSYEGVDALLRYRGSQIGHPHAEGFEVIRHMLCS